MKQGRYTKSGYLVLCLVAVALATAGAAQADAGDRTVRLSVGYMSPTGGTTTVGGPFSNYYDTPLVGTLEGFQRLGIEAESSLGFDFGYEYMLTDLIGLDGHIGYSRFDLEGVYSGDITWTPWTGFPPAPRSDLSETSMITGKQTGSMNAMPLTVGVNFHLTPSSPVDFYLGPVVGYVFLSSINGDGGEMRAEFEEFTSVTPLEGGTLATKDAFTYGAVAGLDVPFGEKGWSFAASARYLKMAVEIDEPDEIDATIDIDPLSLQVAVGTASRLTAERTKDSTAPRGDLHRGAGLCGSRKL